MQLKFIICSMDLGLKEKIIIVTGGSKGIGKGIVSLLVEENATPVIIGRNKESINDLVNFYSKTGIKIGYAFAELTDQIQCRDAIEKTINDFGRIDGLVNNAGVNDNIGLESGNYDNFLESIKRNLAHYYLMVKLTLPQLKKK